MRRIIAAMALYLAFAAHGAYAACGLSISAGNVSVNWNLNYSLQSVQFTLQKSAAQACDFWVGFTKGGAGSAATRRVTSGTRTLSYQLYSDNSRTLMLQDNTDTTITNPNQVLTGGFQTGTNLSQTLLYYLDIPFSNATSPTIVKDGSYTDTYTMNVYEGSDPTLAGATPVVSVTVTLTVTVPKMINLSLVNTGGAFDQSSINRNIDFGNLAAGQSSTFDLRIRTNAGFSVTFSSGGNGVMHRPPATTGPGVPYTMYVNGVALNLSSSAGTPVVGLSGSGETPLQGLGYPVQVVIGSFTNALLVGGQHQDSILITATTTE